MIKRIWAIILSMVLLLSASLTTYACDEEQTNIYALKVLFGNESYAFENNKNVEELFSALYICCEQADKNGQEKLDLLKKARVGGVPTLDKINISSTQLYACSHNRWLLETKGIEKVQGARKELLRKSVSHVFKYNWLSAKINKDKIDSFAALLYYTHILADYLADDPEDTEISAYGFNVPSYTGKDHIELKGNKAEFTSKEKKGSDSYIKFSSIDKLGRTGVATALLGPDTLAPADSRQDIGNIKPSGWNQNKYEGFVSSQPPYLYNRCHLISHKLANQDIANNLITGTRYLNEAMIPFENEVVDYITKTGNHVLYRATPIYVGNNTLANGVKLEAYSVEDKGKGVQFNVYLYNVQPGIDISYEDGSNGLADQIKNADGILPFSIANGGESNPDLLYEIRNQLEILFSDQKNSSTYKTMMNELDLIAGKARSIGGDSEWKYYMAMKECQYEYVEKLSLYVPELLSNEKFFAKIFK